MKNLIKLTIVFSLFCFQFNNAQVVTKKDTISGTPLTLSMDKKINDLLDNLEEKCATPAKNNGYANRDEAKEPAKVVVASRKLTEAEICKQNPRILGFKIQLTVVKSNTEANEVKAFFRKRFPSIKVDTDASLRPNYKILAGSYFTKQSAASDLAKIKAEFKSATLVQYSIFCAEAK